MSLCCSESQPILRAWLQLSAPSEDALDDTDVTNFQLSISFSPSFPPCESTPINSPAVSAHLSFFAFQSCSKAVRDDPQFTHPSPGLGFGVFKALPGSSGTLSCRAACQGLLELLKTSMVHKGRGERDGKWIYKRPLNRKCWLRKSPACKMLENQRMHSHSPSGILVKIRYFVA